MVFVRLDFTVASRAHLLEPQWNPMAEQQAQDRIHRIGQLKDVVTIRYIVKDSIEEVLFLPR
jgi:SWI/SNF-related matrix-associated actin-dependent regulator of chromatin subfamily A3